MYLIPFCKITFYACSTKFLRDLIPTAFPVLAISLITRTTVAFKVTGVEADIS